MWICFNFRELIFNLKLKILEIFEHLSLFRNALFCLEIFKKKMSELELEGRGRFV